MFHLLIIAALISQSAAQKCFIAASSSVPRTLIRTVKVSSSVGCNVTCYEDSKCEAVQFDAAKGECSILGPFLASYQCSSPYTTYEKRPNSECSYLPSPTINAGYSTGSCLAVSDVVKPPTVNVPRPCGTFPIGQGRVVFDAILHNGSRLVLENYHAASVSWDSYLGSWLYILNGAQYYFKCGTCVRSPPHAFPGCECVPAALPVEQPIAGYKDAGVAPVVDVVPMCTSSLVQLRLKRFAINSNYVEVVSTDSRALFCAMGVWMTVVETATNYTEYSVAAATCVEPV